VAALMSQVSRLERVGCARLNAAGSNEEFTQHVGNNGTARQSRPYFGVRIVLKKPK
jgi:hypothetical protein